MPSIPRLPFVPDPLRRIRVPDDLDAVTTVAEEERAGDAGLSDEVIERIWDAGIDLYRSGVHPALQLCVRREGHVVLDRAIGHVSGNGPDDDDGGAPKVLVTPEVPYSVMSASKAVTAMVIHKLIENGALTLEDRISDHIPGYDRHGKSDITIGHVLSHRAGVAGMPRDSLDLDKVTDREFILEAICDAKPNYKPGQLLAYHAVSGGFILGEVVHNVTGKDIRQVLAEEILDPLGFRWMNYGVAEADLDAVGDDYITGPRLLPPFSTIVTRALGAPINEVIEATNDPRFRRAIVPSANICTTANELSRFFEILRCGGELDGVRVFEPGTIRLALTEQSHLEVDFSLGFPTRFSYGLMLGAKIVSLYGRDTDEAFGHLGLINIMGWADPERGVSVGLITSGKAIVYPQLHRFLGVMQRIASEVPKVTYEERPF
ncbi:MAG: serine hydrolase domain-containing protein [Solirubrobacterales bacterium]